MTSVTSLATIGGRHHVGAAIEELRRLPKHHNEMKVYQKHLICREPKSLH
jgi:hypothetical protein